MLLAPGSEMITRDRLMNTRWVWAELHKPSLTKSFYFGADGLIKVWLSDNEKSWAIDNGIIKIYNNAGAVMWAFEIVLCLDGRLTMISKSPRHSPWETYYCLTEYAAEAGAQTADADFVPEDGGGGGGNEGVRLVIWDLDDTFWQGTISEGEVSINDDHVAMILALTNRGIINSICSKNDYDVAKAKLEALGIWDYFVFPEIAWQPKGAMVKNIIRNVQLRPETVMFIDDNETNLNEAKYYLPKLQVAAPDFIKGLLADPRFAGKPDPSATRLARYKVLETKQVEKAAAAGDNTKFLRDSEIRVSFHTDILEQFPRIHELVNRTNQLNFTKNRWPEDIEAAREVFLQEETKFGGHSGYVKVADRYGKYGICGFYSIQQEDSQHFLFSCRSMNMGVEQYVWTRLNRPFVRVNGGVISDLDAPVDWISVVDDADADIEPAANDFRKRLKLCIRGACDMSMLSNFLRVQVDTVEELTFAYQGWEICALPRIVALHEDLQRPENQEIVAKLPGLPPGRFESDINVGTCDVYVMSFSQETFQGQYKHRRTGLIVPMGHFSLGHWLDQKLDYTKVSYDDILSHGVQNVSRERWAFLASEFEFVGGFNPLQFSSDLAQVFAKLTGKGKHVIIVGLNEVVGHNKPMLEVFGKVNRIVIPMARAAGFDFIDINQLVRNEEDLTPDAGGSHYSRETYYKLSQIILSLIKNKTVISEAA
ncbi:MAG TPA: HAD-IIIC family phosphatase [Acidocella sp.]|nr:HAD-IIIC family phosphatase [Acidocella sp.]